MVLVDTTVWIDWLRGTAGAAAERLATLLEDGDALYARCRRG